MKQTKADIVFRIASTILGIRNTMSAFVCFML